MIKQLKFGDFIACNRAQKSHYLVQHKAVLWEATASLFMPRVFIFRNTYFCNFCRNCYLSKRLGREKTWRAALG